MTCKIVIVDSGIGNFHSVKRKLHRLKTESSISSDPQEILEADKIILVGVGHFKKAMKNLTELNLIDALNEKVLVQKKPVLGICLGMQLMAERSEEGNVNGLGWIEAEIKKIKVDDNLKFKVPHMGWNGIVKSKKSSLMKGIDNSTEFYFVHSYYCKAKNDEIILNESEYAFKFTSAIEKENIFGVQYHPEKSHEAGDILLSNFINL